MRRTVTAFRWVPPMAHGYVKDLRVRWALEEAGFDHDVELIGGSTPESAEYRARQPFGQVPVYREDDLELFESGAIVLHIARQSPALMPADAQGRARVESWVFAALNSIEPFAQNLIQHGDAADAALRIRFQEILDKRLTQLAARLGDQDYIEDRFTAADLMIAMVIRELVESGVLARHPKLDAHRARCEARPAFQRALAAQLQAFRENAPG